MSRVASVNIQFQADLTAAESAYRRFLSEVEGRPVRIPMSGDGGGSATVSTFNGTTAAAAATGPASPAAVLSQSSGFNPASFAAQFATLPQQIAQAVSQAVRAASLAAAGPDLAELNANGLISNAAAIEAGGTEILPGGGAIAGGRGRAGRRGGGLFGLGPRAAFGGFVALRGLSAMADAVQHNQELDDLEGRDAEGGARSRLRDLESQQRSPVTAALRTAALGSIPEWIRKRAGLDNPEYIDDQVAQGRQAVATYEGGNAARTLNRGRIETQRRTSTLDLDELGQASARAQFDYSDARNTASEQRRSAQQRFQNFGVDPKEATAAADAFEKAAKEFYEKEKGRFDRLKQERRDDVGYEGDIAGSRAGNRTLEAERGTLALRQREELRQAKLSGDPELIRRTLAKQANESAALSGDQTRDVDRLNATLVTEQTELFAGLRRDPLGARLAGIRGAADDRLRALSKDREFDPARAQIKENEKLQEDEARQDESDRRERVGLKLQGRGEQLGFMLAHNPVGAQVSGIVTGGLEESLALKNAGLGQFRAQALNNSISELNLTRQNFLEGFHATQIGQNFDTSSARAQQDVGTILQNINDGVGKLTQAIADVAAGK